MSLRIAVSGKLFIPSLVILMSVIVIFLSSLMLALAAPPLPLAYLMDPDSALARKCVYLDVDEIDNCFLPLPDG